jgi:RimJ/RimL family protein N-acetyltransferase
VRERDWPVIQGDGFVLRELALADAAAWRAGEDRELWRWFQIPPATHSQVLSAIAAWRASWHEDGPVRHWGIWEQPEDVVVGGVEVRDRGDGRANLSYVVFPIARGRGYARAAARLASEWALAHMPINAVVAIVDKENIASRRVVEGGGFRFDGLADPSEYSETGVMLRYVLEAGDVRAADSL